MSRCECHMNVAPMMGEHNELVFKELMKMPDEEFDTLVREEVIV